MKEKKDIFNGKIKKEYFSYILIYMIFIALLMLVVGGMVLGVGLWANAGPVLAIIFMRILGVVIIALGIAYIVGCMLVIRKYPKYEKIRRILYNSDYYFVDSNSKEYYGRTRGNRGRRDRAAFELVTRFADAEKGMGNNKPLKYKIYSFLAILMAVLTLAFLFTVPILFEKGVILSKMSDDVFAFLFISVAIIFLAFAIFFIIRAYYVAIMAPYENLKWKHELYTSLVNISVRKNNKKLKYWYDADQLEQIENLIKSASPNAELQSERERNKIHSFTVMDKLNNHAVFTGFFE